MPDNVYVGSAFADAPEHRGWLLGHFMPAGELLHSTDVEIKWGVHPRGERRPPITGARRHGHIERR